MTAPSAPSIRTVRRKPVIDYVTKDYDGFRQGMLDQIPLLLPEWTDRSENDFGVVLVELFAYVADILSYYQDRVANEAYLMTATQRRSVVELLRLIDYRVDPGLAASVHLHLDATADVTVSAGALPFVVQSGGEPGQADLRFEVTDEFSLSPLNNAVDLSGLASGALAANTAAIVLPAGAHALAEGMTVYVEEERIVSGEPIVVRSGLLTVTAVEPAGSDSVVRWAPALSTGFNPADAVLKGNNIPATHGETITDEPVFIGDGAPGQRMTLSRRPVTHLLTPDAVTRRGSAPQLRVRVNGERWDEVRNFIDSTPADRHYVTSIDENDYLTITFGSGQRGAILPAGARVEASYRVGLGSGGNAGADRITVAISSVPEISAVTNPFSATGGADRETLDEARVSGPGSVIAQERAVTLEDYALLSMGFPGVGKAGATVGLRGGYKVVRVHVAPENPAVPPVPPAPELKERLKAFLEARMPVNRMAGVEVVDPAYVPIDVVVDVHVKAEAHRAPVRDGVVSRLRDLLAFDNQQFGQPVRVGEIYALFHGVEGIAYTVLRGLSRADEATAPVEEGCAVADVAIAVNELAHEGTLTVQLTGGVA